MDAYLYIFESIPLTIILLVSIAFFSAIIFRSTLVFRSILFSNLIWLASIYYLLYIFENNIYEPEIILALFVELFLLFIYIILFHRLFKVTAYCQDDKVIQFKWWLKIVIVVYIIIYLQLLLQEGYGLFSDSSRIQYIEFSSFNRYSTFFCVILGNIGLALSAAIINRVRRWDKLVLLFLFIMLGSGLLAGSKGGFVLSILALLSLVHIPNIKDYLRFLILPILACVVTIVSTVIFVGKFMLLDTMQMITLMFSRVFLCNDSRALSIDFTNELNRWGISLFQESFRGIFTLIGFPPSNLPLGQMLYQLAFSTQTYSGGNTSSTALIIAYGNEYEKCIFSFCLCMLSVLIFFLVRKSSKYSIPTSAVSLVLITLLSQDFLAFSIIINMLVGFILAYYLWIKIMERVIARISVDRMTNKPIYQK
jgi:hypothetical protein